MGYMGFGMANWVYKRRSRKPFSKRSTKPTCNTLPNYNRKFKLQPSKKSSRLYIVSGLILLLLVSVGLFTKVPAFLDYSESIDYQKHELLIRRDAEAFSFLMRSGRERLMRGDFIEAYSEFQLAKKIEPKNKILNQLMIETLSSLCENENHFCVKLDTLLSSGL